MKGSVIITGGNKGLGLHCAMNLAQHGFFCILACRDQRVASEAVEKIHDGQSAVSLPLDLSSFASVNNFVDSFLDQSALHSWPPLVGLVANAGIQVVSGITTTPNDGIETTFQVNHLSHMLLIHRLIPHMHARHSRIVIVSSDLHFSAKERPSEGFLAMPPPLYETAELLAHPNQQKQQNENNVVSGRRAYATSKLCNVLYSNALSKKLANSNITVNAFSPGLMPGTDLARDYNAFQRFVWNYILPLAIPFSRNVNSVATSGANLARLIIDPELEGVTGKYFDRAEEKSSSLASYDQYLQQDLWETSSRLLGIKY